MADPIYVSDNFNCMLSGSFAVQQEVNRIMVTNLCALYNSDYRRRDMCLYEESVLWTVDFHDFLNVGGCT